MPSPAPDANAFSSLAEQSSDFVGVADLAGRPQFLNPAGLRLVGLASPDELRQYTLADFFAPADRATFEQTILPTVLRAGRWRGPFRLRHFGTGALIPVDYHLFALTAPGTGQPVALATVTRDTTEQTRTQELLRESEAQFRQLADSLPQLVWVTRPDGYHEWYNRRWYEYTGTTEEQTAGAGWNELFHAADRERAWHAWHHSLTTGEPYEIEYRCRRYDGEFRWFLGRALPVRDGSGHIVRWFGTCTDIHDYQELRAQAQRRERELGSLLDNTPDVICRYGPDLRYLFVNSAFARHIPFAPAQLIGKTHQDLGLPPDLVQQFDQCLQAVFATSQPVSIEWTLPGSSGPRHYTGSAVPEFAPDSRTVESVMTITREVTSQRLAEERLLRSNEELQQFAYAASHDLQEPLRTITSYSQLLARRYGPQLDESAHEYLHFVTDAAKRLHGLIQELLSYSRAGSQAPVHVQPLDLNQVLATVLASLGTALAESGAQVVAAPLPTVLGDAAQVSQVLQNLLGNAIKYREAARPLAVTVSALHDGGAWRIIVRDNGQGFTPEQAEAIFLPFKRLHGREIPGTGVGLALCRKIVERHGGRIWAEGQPGAGAAFHFTLPAA